MKIRIPLALIREGSSPPAPPSERSQPAASDSGDFPSSGNLRVWLAFATGIVSICALTIVQITGGASFSYVLGLSAIAVLPAVIRTP